MTLHITLDAVTDWDALGRRWRDLEARAAGSFFQSWTWVGCLAAERFDRPVLLEARREGRTVALALFNRRPGWLRDTLLLHETGDARWDALFIEHNGVLMEEGAEAALCAACLSAARHTRLSGAARAVFGRRVVLSGVDSAHLAAAGATGAISFRQTRMAPTLDLAALRRRGQGHLDVVSANTRAQLRRSLRRYAQVGAVAVERAADPSVAHGFLDALADLHQASWQRRGRPGAFADPVFVRFHHTLIDRALPGEVNLLRFTAGSAVFGYLYNFCYSRRMLAYQSGFDYAVVDRQQKPGLTCHHLAIERNLREGCNVYDFLAGEDRYKRSLADGGSAMHWLRVGSRLDPARLRGLPAGEVKKLRGCVKNWLARD